MSKRTLLLVVALIVSVAVASTGTLAYLTATDSDVNVMTLGNVAIEQHEMKRAEGIAHNATLEDGDLVPFEDGIQLYPAYPVNNAGSDYTAEATDLLKWGPYVHTGTAANGLWNEDKLVGAVDKMVFVENTGSSDAYFRTVIAFECPEGITIGEPSQGAEIMVNETGSGLYTPHAERFVDYITVNGVRYAMFQYVYADALLPGEWSHPSLLQVVMTHHATSEDMTLLGDTYEILVVSQAVATENMPEDAAEALNTAFGELSATSHPWMAEGEEGAQPPYAAAVEVSTEEELVAALTAGQSAKLMADVELTDGPILIDGGSSVALDLNGKTLTDTSDNMTLWVKPGSKLTITGNGTILKTDHNENMVYYDGALDVVNGTFKYAEYTWGECSGCSHGTNPLKVGCMFVGRASEAKGFEGKLCINGGIFDPGVTNPEAFVTGNGTNVLMFAVLNNHASTPSEMTVYGGTYISVDPAMGDANAPHTLYLKGQTAAGEVPEGYTITESTLEDGRTAYTVSYSK